MGEDGTEAAAGETRNQGWYPIPEEPNYERYWDGTQWTSHRYWGGEGAQPESQSAREAEAAAEEDELDRSLDWSTPSAPIAVGLLLSAVIIAFVVLGILPWGVLLFLVAIPLVVLALRRPRRGT